MNYWAKRQFELQQKLTDKSIMATEKQLAKYYKTAMNKVVADFESTYNKLLATVDKDRTPTPADLYKMDKYWKMQAQLQNELQKLGDKEAKLFSKKFMEQYKAIYDAVGLEGVNGFVTADTTIARQLINAVWCADGKTWSQRIWNNTEKLADTLNEELVHCVVSGKKPDYLNKILMKRFNVSYNRADTLVRTEMAHIQTESTAQKYKDYGIERYKFLADPDERTCDVCGKLDGRIFLLSEMQVGVNAPPMHPRDRCCIVPVIEHK